MAKQMKKLTVNNARVSEFDGEYTILELDKNGTIISEMTMADILGQFVNEDGITVTISKTEEI